VKPSARPATSARRASPPTSGARRPEVARRGAERRIPRWLTHPALLSALIALLLYLPSIGFDFVRDDHELIVRNAFLRRDGFLGRLLTSDFWASAAQGAHLWRPLVTFSFWLEGRMFGWNPAGFHAVNVLAHAAASGVLAVLMLGAGVPRLAALIAGIWFATTPVHVESVAWIAGRTDVLCALFAFLALALDRRARRAGRSHPGVWAPVALLVALLAKEAALPVFAVLAIAWWVDANPPRTLRAMARWLAPYAVVTIVYLIAHEVFAAPLGRPSWVDPETVNRIRWSGWTMLAGYAAMLWPGFPHTPDYALPLPSGPSDPRVLVGAAITIAVIAGASFLVMRRSRASEPAWLTLLPLLLPIVLAWSRGHLTFAERLWYLPSGGLAWLLALGWQRLNTAPRWIRRGGIALVVAWLGAGFWSAGTLIPTWKDDLTMYASLARTQPHNVRGRIGLANQLSAEGRDDEALAELAQVETIDPRMPELHATRAVIHYRHGRWPEVLASAEQALALDPGQPQAQLLRATALLRLRRLDLADSALTALLAARPADPAIEGIWGQLLLVRGETAAAIPFLDRAAHWNQDDASVSYALGVACQIERRWPEALAAFQRTVAIDPVYYEAWLRLSVSAHESGDPATRDQALATARALPEAADGRVEALTRAWGSP
jgi:protein O-mannosyl-transferase